MNRLTTEQFNSMNADEQLALLTQDERTSCFMGGAFIGVYGTAVVALVAKAVSAQRKARKERKENSEREFQNCLKRNDWKCIFTSTKNNRKIMGEHYFKADSYELAVERAINIQNNRENDLYYTTFSLEDIRHIK